MNRKRLRWILGLICILAMVTACRGSTDKTPKVKATAIPEPESGKATVTGEVFSTPVNGPYPKAAVWLAQIYRQGDQGAYVLDHAFSPAVWADENGVFVIANVDPVEYVIVIGDPEGQYEVIPDDTGRARAWQTEAGKILDVGRLSISLTPPTPFTPPTPNTP